MINTRNIFYEFNGFVKQQFLGTTIGTNCAPAYTYIFMDEVETEFLKRLVKICKDT